MKRENWVFLLSGVAFGVLVGLAIAQGLRGPSRTQGAPTTPGPAGPAAMGAQAPAGGAAPMMAEIAALKQRVADDPRDLEALVRLGNLFYDVQMWGDAKRYYEQALTVRPNDPNLLTDLGICSVETAEFPRALELFESASALDPTHWQSVYNIAVVTGLHMGLFDRAEQTLARLRVMNPQAPNLDRLRARIEDARREAGSPTP